MQGLDHGNCGCKPVLPCMRRDGSILSAHPNSPLPHDDRRDREGGRMNAI